MNKFRVKTSAKRANRLRSARACGGCRGRKTHPDDDDSHHSKDFSDKEAGYWMEAERRSSKRRPVDWGMVLPHYASPLSPSITRADCNILHNEGVFEVPHGSVRDELLRSYVQYVHLILPILNLDDFLTVIDKSYTGHKGVSFLLFQAVLFAATAFETLESLALDGYESRRDARKARFERVKMLYAFGCEDDRVTVLQTVLLMTYWDGSSDGAQDDWHFVGVAKALLESIEMEPTDDEAELFQQQPGFWKRLYWSCYMRDRLVAIAMRRPVQIDEAEFDIDMLNPADLDVGPLSTKSCVGKDGSHPAMRDPSMHSLLSQTTILLAQCCRCIGRVLECQYTKQNSSLVLKSPSSAEVLLRDCELEEWNRSLPLPLQWSSSDPLHDISKQTDVILFHRALLNSIYHLTSITLHRRQLSSSRLRLSEMISISKQRAHHSATAIAEIFDFCILNHPFPLLSDSQVAALESAILAHLSDLQSLVSSTRQSAIGHFQTCFRALQHLANTYPSADVTLAYVDDAVCKAETDRDSEPTISQQLDDLQVPQMGRLLCSHFMMTSSERSLLEDLLSSEEELPSSVDDDSDTGPCLEGIQGYLDRNNGSNKPKLPFFVDGEATTPAQNEYQQDDDWFFFQTMAQFHTE